MPRLRLASWVIVVPVLVACTLSALGQTPLQKQRAQQMYLQAGQLEKDKKYKQAVETMKDALKIVPKSDTFLAYAAKLESLAGNHADGLEHVLQAVKINPKNTAYVVQTLKTAVDAQDFDVAKEYADKVIALGAKKVGQANFDEAKTLLATADTRKADKLRSDAVALQLERKFDAALGKAKEAAAVTPKNEALAAYAAQLEMLAAQDLLDQHALKAPADAEKTIAGLASYLATPAKTERDKVRVIFRWITDRVAYNVEDFLAGRFGDNTPDGVLKNRKAVCEGYANLFDALGKDLGITVVKVKGYAKGVGYVNGMEIPRSNHAWNAVQIDGKWHLLDSTWGAGSLNGKEFQKRFEEFYFLTPADQMVFSHYPDEPKWQLMTPIIPAKEFQQWPKVDRGLFQFGLKASDVRSHLQDKAAAGLVSAFTYTNLNVSVQKAPLERQLKPGEYAFRIEAVGVRELAVINNGKFTFLKKTGNLFEGSVFAQKGDLQVGGKMANRDDNIYSTILKYAVE